MKNINIYYKNLLILVAFTVLIVLFPWILSQSVGEHGRVTVNETVTLPFEVDNDKNVLLLFFGFAGCSTICVPSMEEVTNLYEQVTPKTAIQLYFIDILGQKNRYADDYAQSFHKDFKGVNLSPKPLQTMMRTFDVYTSESLIPGNEPTHSGHLYLLRREDANQWRLRFIYPIRPFDRPGIIQDLQNEVAK